MTAPIPCVGGIVVDDRPGAPWRLLLVRRGQEPAKGTWSVPGGRVEPGESDESATAREVLEETGLRVDVGRLVGTVERDAPGGGVYVIRDYACRPASGADVAFDRSVFAGEALGRWLWLVLRPASAALLLNDEWVLMDVADLGPELMELPFGGSPPGW